MRISFQVLLSETHQCKKLKHTGSDLASLANLVYQERLSDATFYFLPGVERTVRILEDKLHFATVLPKLFGTQFQYRLAIVTYLAFTWLDQFCNQSCKCALSRASFSNDSEGLSFSYCKTYSVDCLYNILCLPQGSNHIDVFLDPHHFKQRDFTHFSNSPVGIRDKLLPFLAFL